MYDVIDMANNDIKTYKNEKFEKKKTFRNVWNGLK